jgi:hypothetical protein
MVSVIMSYAILRNIKGSFDENFCSNGQAGDFLQLDWHWYICIDIGYRSTD